MGLASILFLNFTVDWLVACFEKGCCNNKNTSYFTSLKTIHSEQRLVFNFTSIFL